jgi:uroporphyrinogen decarboxylase
VEQPSHPFAARKILVLAGADAKKSERQVGEVGGQAVTAPPEQAVRRLLQREVTAVLVSRADQVPGLLDAAAETGDRVRLREILSDLPIAALTAEAGSALAAFGLGKHWLAESGDLERLVQCSAVDIRPDPEAVFLKACRRQKVPFTPIWLMRQAGRYMAAYRHIRANVSMLELCRSPELVSEVTVHAAETLDVDAAIIFADLLLVVEPLGLKLEYRAGEGPAITPAIRDGQAIDSLREVQPADLEYVYEAIRRTRADLVGRIPLIGFAGAPFTVGSYLVEGGASRHFRHTKALMYGDEGAWNALMSHIVRATVGYVQHQIEAGAQAIQLFDSWVGCLSPADYRRYVQPHTAAVLRDLPEGVPIIHFGTGTAALLRDMKIAGGNVIGVDWRVDLDDAWNRIGPDTAVMGNLDPLCLFGDEAVLRREVERILRQADNRDGHIFNLGHGILPETPVENVRRLVDLVHELSRR